MTDFTVVGFHYDTLQRFSTYIRAIGPDDAEDLCIIQHPGVVVCAVFLGCHAPVDTAEYVEDFPI